MNNTIFIIENSTHCQEVLNFCQENNLMQYFDLFIINSNELKEKAFKNYGVSAVPTVILQMYSNDYRKKGKDECIKVLKDFKKSLIMETFGKGPSYENMRDPISYDVIKNVSFTDETIKIEPEYETIEPEYEEIEEYEPVEEKPQKFEGRQKQSSYKKIKKNNYEQNNEEPQQENKKKYKNNYGLNFKPEDIPDLPDIYNRKKNDYL